MIRNLLIVVTLIFCLINQANAQCCGAGNPTSFAFSDKVSLKAKTLHVGTSYKYGYSEKYFSENKPIDVPFKAPASFSYMDLNIGYGLNRFFTIQVETGYFFSKKQLNPMPLSDDRGYGLGDLYLTTRYRFYKNAWKRTESNIVAGVRLPIGVFDQEVDGVKLPITLQPSSGSVVYTGLLSVSRSLREKDISFFASIGAEFPQLIESKNFYFRYGNLYNFSIASAYRMNKYFTPAVQLQGELRGYARREHDRRVESSGYRIIYLSPQLESEISHNWTLRVQADLPIYRYFNGFQLANAFKVGVTLTKKIYFNS